MENIFRGEGKYFNHEEIERMICFISSISANGSGSIEIDLSQYSFFGLHETQILLLVLRELSRRYPQPKFLRLPEKNSTLSFLERWDFFTEIIRNQSDYFSLNYETITVGRSIPISSFLEKINKLSRSEDNEGYLSKRVVPIQRISKYQDVKECTKQLYAPKIMSVLIGHMNRNLNEVQQFANLILYELLDNIIEHVTAYRKSNVGEEEITEPRIGFHSIQTHIDESTLKYGNEYFSKRWHPNIRPFINSCKNGIVELSVVDDGAGVGQTILPFYELVNKRSTNEELELLKFACEPGTSRKKYKIEAYKQELKDLEEIIKNRNIEELHNYVQTQYTMNRNELNQGNSTGYGLYIVSNTVKEWKGIMIIRSKNVYYCPHDPCTGKSFSINKCEYFPGVQVLILLPR